MRYYPGITGTSWSRANITKDYQENIHYDGNGNILNYGRNGDIANTAQTIDSLGYAYNYNAGGRLINNKLNYIDDHVANSGYDLDIRNQTSKTNYQYDAIGNLLSDQQNGITNTDWTVYNKPDIIYKATGNITYNYNTANQRISKTFNGLTTWYVHDAQGNVMGLYDNAGSTLNWREQDLYGSSRLGMWRPNFNLATGNALIQWGVNGSSVYEMDNHLDNQMATISDARVPVTSGSYFAASVLSAQDYYVFGMPKPNRQYVLTGDSAYRYGFNGKELDNEIMGYGNSLDYGERFYDPRIGRFRSVDPLYRDFPELSSFQFASNSPIQAIDIDGLEKYIVSNFLDNNNRLKEKIITSQVDERNPQNVVDMNFKSINGDKYARKDVVINSYNATGELTNSVQQENLSDDDRKFYNDYKQNSTKQNGTPLYKINPTPKTQIKEPNENAGLDQVVATAKYLYSVMTQSITSQLQILFQKI